MKIQLLSDLHLENAPDFNAQLAPGVDVLVLAGDIGSYQPGSRLTGDDFGLGRFAPARLAKGSGQPPPVVLYVPGNHEYDHLDFDRTHARLRDVCEALGIVWLERATRLIHGVRFVGTTLWADFEALVPPRASDAVRQKATHKAFRAANFYLAKNTCLRDGQPMMAEAMRELSLACQAWLRDALAVPFDGPTVAVTHFAPSLRSADPRYGLAPGTAGFCNALDDLFDHADLWLHGHLHCQQDYTVKLGVDRQPQGRPARQSCRVVANPLGYASKGEQEGFGATRVIELPG